MIVRARDLGRVGGDLSDFVARHPAPALLLPRSPARRERAGLAVQTLLDLDPQAPGTSTADLADAEVLFVEKSGRNPFATMITLGRASNNDLIVPAQTVSKFHASFARGPGGWLLTDQRSANGTWVDGRRVEAGATVALAEEAWLRFGRDVLARWLEPAALFRALRADRPPGR